MPLLSLRSLTSLAGATCLLTAFLASAQPEPNPAPDSTKAVAAAKVLKAYHGAGPVPSKRVLRVVYFTPSDRTPPEGWQPRVQRVVDHIRDYFTREMKRNGFSARPIPLPLDGKGEPIITLVKGRLPLNGYTGKSGGAIRDEAAAVLKKDGVDVNRETLLIFCNLSVVKGDSISGDSPYYGGGSARSGTAWVSDAPWLDPVSLKEKEKQVQDRQNGRISLGKYNTIFIGGTAHELGHGLGLPHDRESGAERPLGTSLMGSGNYTYGEELRGQGKGSFLAFADALRLASHPLLSGSDKGVAEATTARLEKLAVEPGKKGFVVRGVVKSSLPCYGLVAYLDPAGGSDYDARTATAVPGPDGAFVLSCGDLDAGKPAELRIVMALVNGATHTESFRYDVTKAGEPVLDEMRVDLLLAPAFAAWRKGDRTAFRAAVATAVKDLPADDGVRRWAETLEQTLGAPTEPAPAAVTAGKKAVQLSLCRASAEEVGYGKPARNYFPEQKYLSVKGERHAHGLYAHAPARHAFDLGGKWQRLQGSAGLQDGAYGKVVFVIKGDGKELWRSKAVSPEQLVTFDVKVGGVNELELIVEDGGDGKASDWGVWLSPRLSR